MSNLNPLFELIRNKITAQSWLNFADYMALALYHPQYGYYQNLRSIGELGDFTTAPELSSLFAKALAKQCAELLLHLGNGEILEIGAGSGKLACELWSALLTLGIKPKKYYIFELSKTLREQQKAYISQHLPEDQVSFEWLDQAPKQLTGIILANEVLDALPVHCFAWQNQTLFERTVVLHNEQLTWGYQQPSAMLQAAVSTLPMPADTHQVYASEINLNYQQFMTTWANSLQKGAMILIDYGYGVREYYHPERNQGTLTCFYQHQKNHNPFQHLGYQDITAHVDFSALTSAAVDQGLSLSGFTTQAGFLLGCDLPNLVIEAENRLSEIEKLRLHQAIKKMIFPTEMGECIKVICFEKNLFIPRTLRGFQLQDRRRDL